MQFLEKTKKSIFSLIILVLLISSFFIFKFALQKEKIYSPKITDNQIFTDFAKLSFGMRGHWQTSITQHHVGTNRYALGGRGLL